MMRMDFSVLNRKIDRNSPVPLYHQLKQLLMEEISSGELKPDTLLPPEMESFHQEMSHLGMTPSTEVLRLEIVPGIPGYNERLNLNDNEDLVLLERLCRGDGEPLVYQESYLPASRFAGLVQEDLSAHSLYRTLHERFGTDVVHIHRQIEAVNASHTVANLLKIARSQAICLVENVAYDQLGVPVEYNLSRYRGDRNKFSLDMHEEDIPIEP